MVNGDDVVAANKKRETMKNKTHERVTGRRLIVLGSAILRKHSFNSSPKFYVKSYVNYSSALVT
mgnify:CR=1 FL=1